MGWKIPGVSQKSIQAIFLAVKILEWNGKKPGDDDLENEIIYLIKQIIKEKIELLGTYLK